MNRREFTTLLCMLPLLDIKPPPRPANQLHCRACGELVGVVLWPHKVLKEGGSWCAAHAEPQNGRGLIEDYHFGFYDGPPARAEIKRQQDEFDMDQDQMVRQIVEEVRAEKKRERKLYRRFYNAPAVERSLDLHAEISGRVAQLVRVPAS